MAAPTETEKQISTNQQKTKQPEVPSGRRGDILGFFRNPVRVALAALTVAVGTANLSPNVRNAESQFVDAAHTALVQPVQPNTSTPTVSVIRATPTETTTINQTENQKNKDFIVALGNAWLNPQNKITDPTVQTAIDGLEGNSTAHAELGKLVSSSDIAAYYAGYFETKEGALILTYLIKSPQGQHEILMVTAGFYTPSQHFDSYGVGTMGSGGFSFRNGTRGLGGNLLETVDRTISETKQAFDSAQQKYLLSRYCVVDLTQYSPSEAEISPTLAAEEKVHKLQVDAVLNYLSGNPSVPLPSSIVTSDQDLATILNTINPAQLPPSGRTYFI